MDDHIIIPSPLFAKNSEVGDFAGDKSFIICTAMNQIVNSIQAISAQKVRGLWLLYVKSETARSSLLRHGYITIHGRRIHLHNDNPFTTTKVHTERVTIRDLPLHESNDLILDYLATQPQIDISGSLFWSMARNELNQESPYMNGDRVIEVRADFHPPLPKEVTLGGYPCRIYHPTQKEICFRCQKTSHYTGEVHVCEAYLPPDQQHRIHPIRSPLNPLINYWPVKISLDDQEFKSAEHAYLWYYCTEVNEPEIAEQVFRAETAAEAKRLSRNLPYGKDFSLWNEKKLSIMKRILEAKAKCSPLFCKTLMNTRDKLIVEATNDRFYGAGLSPHLCNTTKPQCYPGENHLGRLLMELRDQLKDGGERRSHDVTSPRQPPSQLFPQPSTHQSSNPESVPSAVPDTSAATDNKLTEPRDNLNRSPNPGISLLKVNPNSVKCDTKRGRPISKATSQIRSNSLPSLPGTIELRRTTQLITGYLHRQVNKSKRKYVKSPTTNDQHDNKRAGMDTDTSDVELTGSVFQSCDGDSDKDITVTR